MNNNHNNKITQGIEFLAQAGLNLFASLDCQTLPQDVTHIMAEQNISLEQYSRLVLLGHGGKQLWQALNVFGHHTPDPIDHYSTVMTKQFIETYLGASSGQTHLMLYPLTSIPIPLQRLGELAGWHHPSPLGIGINAKYGVWFAYRAAFLTTHPLPITPPHTTRSPCDTCYDKPCISACPSGAVQGVGHFDIYKCSDFRILNASPCQDRCLARLACPYAPEHQYRLEQTQYHYSLSMETIRRYKA